VRDLDATTLSATNRLPDVAKAWIQYLWGIGRTYLAFYKAGVKAVFTNQKLARAIIPPHSASGSSGNNNNNNNTNTTPTRAVRLLRARARHDLMRLPVFGLLLICCGEFTPLVIMLFPRLAPYTCRVPRQIAKIRRAAEFRRGASLHALSYSLSSSSPSGANRPATAPGHVCRSLGLSSPIWDRLGVDAPFAKSRADAAVLRLVRDDRLLRERDGARTLVDDEVAIACEERGIDTCGIDVATLRARLASWLEKSAPTASRLGEKEEEEEKEAIEKVWALLMGLDKPI
jgi:hypothetical protein